MTVIYCFRVMFGSGVTCKPNVRLIFDLSTAVFHASGKQQPDKDSSAYTPEGTPSPIETAYHKYWDPIQPMREPTRVTDAF